MHIQIVAAVGWGSGFRARGTGQDPLDDLPPQDEAPRSDRPSRPAPTGTENPTATNTAGASAKSITIN
jgi:hypothetical protein